LLGDHTVIPGELKRQRCGILPGPTVALSAHREAAFASSLSNCGATPHLFDGPARVDTPSLAQGKTTWSTGARVIQSPETSSFAPVQRPRTKRHIHNLEREVIKITNGL